jgi:enoyl-CoA hydratase/carnithine racemase
VREIGPALTKELVLTCRSFDALEARQAGFINRVVAIGDLQTSATELAESLSSKAALTLYATKRHVNAITAQMVGTMHGWSDADGLCTAVSDPECAAARSAYLVAKGRTA